MGNKDFVVKMNISIMRLLKILKQHLMLLFKQSGVRELVDNAESLMGEIELDAERKIVTEFPEEFVKAHPKQIW